MPPSNTISGCAAFHQPANPVAYPVVPQKNALLAARQRREQCVERMPALPKRSPESGAPSATGRSPRRATACKCLRRAPARNGKADVSPASSISIARGSPELNAAQAAAPSANSSVGYRMPQRPQLAQLFPVKRSQISVGTNQADTLAALAIATESRSTVPDRNRSCSNQRDYLFGIEIRRPRRRRAANLSSTNTSPAQAGVRQRDRFPFVTCNNLQPRNLRADRLQRRIHRLVHPGAFA
jgi:hypothetical protein